MHRSIEPSSPRPESRPFLISMLLALVIPSVVACVAPGVSKAPSSLYEERDFAIKKVDKAMIQSLADDRARLLDIEHRLAKAAAAECEEALGEGDLREAQMPLEMTCPIRYALATSPLIVPWQRKRLVITIPLGLVRYAKDDAKLAIAMAHQMAHALFDRPRDDAIGAETRADYLGLQLASKAGYDVGSAIEYWEDVAMEYPSLISEASARWRPLSWGQRGEIEYNELPHADIARRLNSIRRITRKLLRRPILD